MPSELARCWRQRLYLIPLMYISSKASNSNLDQFTTAEKKPQASEQYATPTTATENRLNQHMTSFPNLIQSQIPQSMIPGTRKTFKCDIYQRKSPEELKFVRDFYFIKFMEGLNKLNRADERRSYSKSTIAYIESSQSMSSNSDVCIATSFITNITNTIGQNIMSQTVQPVSSSTQFSTKNQMLTTPTLGVKSMPPPLNLTSPHAELYPLVRRCLETATVQEITDREGKIKKEWKYDEALRAQVIEYLEREYKVHMLNVAHGVPFIQNKTDIPVNCFISAEAIWWCIEHVGGVSNEAEAICLMQIMCDFDVIRHISNQQKVFIHGFYLYYITTSDNRNHHLYTKGDKIFPPKLFLAKNRQISDFEGKLFFKSLMDQCLKQNRLVLPC